MFESFVFFFQAEDGIRDRNVTGVQTCALPIYHRRRRGRGAWPGGRRAVHVARLQLVPARRRAAREARGRPCGRAAVVRSEERRVGKECRSWWWRGPC